jgi:choline dehydrogenase-like flavoprotein
LPYFKRAEHQVRGADTFYGMGGPLCVSDVEQHPICEAFIAAATQLGFPRNDDFNGASQDRVGYRQTTTRNGRRCSTAETDQRTIVAGLRLNRRILANPHFDPFIASEFQPSPVVESDEQLLDYARRRGGTVYHPTSTCKMGSDPLAVVDAELRVHGIGGLRVADASIMPAVVSGNTKAARIMIGEKVADMVRQPMRMAA